MKTLRAIALGCGGVVAVALVGCEHHHHETAEYSEPVPAGYVVIPEGPPPAVREVRPVSPGSDYVWVDGYYDWANGRYAWRPGHWEVPPRGYSYWVAPRYERYEHNYRYEPGHWSNQERHER